MKKKSLVLLVISNIILSSCLSTKVKVNTIYSSGISIDTLNLVSTMIGPVRQPVLPLIDAAAFNAKTNGISEDILNEQQQRIETYKSILVNSLSDKLPAKIITGKDITSENSHKYKIKNGLQIENKNFPIVFFGEGDMNMVDFGKGKNVNEIFKNNYELKNNIADFATALNLKTILISYNRLSVINTRMFGITGNLRLESYLFLYKPNGELLIDAYGWTKPSSISGKDIDQYKSQLDHFKELADALSVELANYIR